MTGQGSIWHRDDPHKLSLGEILLQCARARAARVWLAKDFMRRVPIARQREMVIERRKREEPRP